ncbi:hypothetical protein CH063_15639, partial [Colletotrichum higginsianum]
MTLASREQEFSAVAGVLANVRAKLLQLQLETLLRRRDGDALGDLILADLVGPLEFRFGFEEAARVLEQDLSIPGLDRGVAVLALEPREVGAQLLVPDRLDVDVLAAA